MLEILMLCATLAQTIGKPATAEDIKRVDITVFSNGKGLLPGKGTAAQGLPIYKEKCAECHNEKGEGREAQYAALVGGVGSLASAKPVRTVGSFWPYATTVWDYINRAMPYEKPHTLTADQVYAVTAVLLHWNGIITDTFELNEKTLPQVKMPNRDGFIPDARPYQKLRR